MRASFAKLLVIAVVLLACGRIASASPAPSYQQGTKLVGSGAVGAAYQGISVALSADGNTAVVGGHGDNSTVGAAWVYERSGGVWSQQGTKLVGTGAVGAAYQGISVALSADGNTAFVGGYYDNSSAGAAWVYTRSGGVWSQQGTKLVGTGAVGAAYQGISVALSADGNTAVVGGYRDNSHAGAAWVYTRSGGVWSQQGTKLVGTGAVGAAYQGISVALSADGNTAVVGGFCDNSNAGAAWVYTRSGGVWSQQGTKLVGTGAVGAAYQGISVALSADGNTAVVGGYYDNSNAGAAWVYTRSGGVWSQQGTKLVGTGAVGAAYQGISVALSADGNTAVVGGYCDNSNAGAAWVYTRSGGVWSQQGTKLVGTGAVGTARQGSAVALAADGKTAVECGTSDNSNAGAAWVFVDPAPMIAAIRDVPNDQGGRINLRWDGSLLDNEPGDPMDTYWIWRQVPNSSALVALAEGATLVNGGCMLGVPEGRKFRITRDAAQVYYWEYVGSQVADGYPGYSYTAPTTADSVAWSNPYTLFMVEVKQISTGARWPSAPDSGYSVDNLSPTAPAPFTGQYGNGTTSLHWGVSSAADFATFRLYRGDSPGFMPAPGNLVVAQRDTGYVDHAGAPHYYRLSAVDIHGNESAHALVLPGGTTDVPRGGSIAFALAGAWPNPSTGSLSVTFTLPEARAATLSLYDLCGRCVLERGVGELGPGQHVLSLAADRAFAPGVYLLRLTQGTRAASARVAILK